MKETEIMNSMAYHHYAKTMLAITREGIPADGDEPAIPPQPKMCGCGDLAHQQKLAGKIGGGCK